MLQHLASYFLGGPATAADPSGGVTEGENASNNGGALRTIDHDDGWTIVDQDSEGNSDASSEEDNASVDSLTYVKTPMEESWFVTPPPCFASQPGPGHLRTSPLENLLIEHPSMSVYQRNSPTAEEVEDMDADALDVSPVVVLRLSRGPPQRSVAQLKEVQVVKQRQAQKGQVKKLGQQATPGSIKRSNKTREMNGRNYNQRRKERSQGSTRSRVSNNRKCC